MKEFIQFIMARRHYQMTGEACDAMKQARINNVYRQDDRYSKWERRGLTVPRILLGRFFISIPTVTQLTRTSDPLTVCSDLHSQGLLFNPCIKMDVENHVETALDHWYRVKHCYRQVETLLSTSTPGQIWDVLRYRLGAPNRIEVLNEFRHYEMMTSLSYMPAAPWTENDFFHIGPGAIDMLKKVFGQVPKTLDEAREISRMVASALTHEGFQFRNNHWTFRQVEDCLCEYRKFCRSVELGDKLPEKYRYYPKGRPHTC